MFTFAVWDLAFGSLVGFPLLVKFIEVRWVVFALGA
jgi:hypothetical protein